MALQDDPSELKYAFERVSDDKVARYDEIRAKAEEEYGSFGTLICPALADRGNGEVVFTSEGFNHLVYRIKKHERNRRVQIMRFELLSKAKELLEKTTTVQEYEEYPRTIRVHQYKQKSYKTVQIRDWGFVGIVRGYRIKVVVRQEGVGGIKKFHSVIPAWATRYYRDIKIIRNTKGNVAED